jgi:hypothetical protein
VKKGKEFIFPENVDMQFGIWKDYTLKDFGVIGLSALIGLAFVGIPPYGLIFVAIKLFVVILAMTTVMAILTIKPVRARKNIKVRDYLRIRQKYQKGQKLYYLAPKKRDR